MGRIALIIIYNHRYDANIEKLEWLYRGKFSQIFHLVPFYDGPRENVIPVYEHSHCFHGYVAQGFKSFFRDEFEHYLFAADDMVLHPGLTEETCRAFFHLDAHTSFLPAFISLHELTYCWPHTRKAVEYRPSSGGVQGGRELPDPEQARRLFQQHGLALGPVAFPRVYGQPWFPKSWSSAMELARWGVKRLKFGPWVQPAYPLVGSYSDLFAVDAHTIRKFCRYCGIFAATRLFVELAIPTALVLSASRIVTEKDLDLKGGALWTAAHRDLLKPFENRLPRLLAAYPPDYLYLHPVKLSQWSLEDP